MSGQPERLPGGFSSWFSVIKNKKVLHGIDRIEARSSKLKAQRIMQPASPLLAQVHGLQKIIQ